MSKSTIFPKEFFDEGGPSPYIFFRAIMINVLHFDNYPVV